MIWMLLGGSLLLGIMVIRLTYGIERKRHSKERDEVARQMKEFNDALKKVQPKK